MVGGWTAHTPSQQSNAFIREVRVLRRGWEAQGSVSLTDRREQRIAPEPMDPGLSVRAQPTHTPLRCSIIGTNSRTRKEVYETAILRSPICRSFFRAHPQRQTISARRHL